MKEKVVCLWTYGRRPVRERPPLGLCDPQAELPAGWCAVCGMEVYDPRAQLCRRCRNMRQ